MHPECTEAELQAECRRTAAMLTHLCVSDGLTVLVTTLVIIAKAAGLDRAAVDRALDVLWGRPN